MGVFLIRIIGFSEVILPEPFEPKVPLSRLLPAIPGVVSVSEAGRLPSSIVSGVCLDSRQVTSGDVFVALTGGSADGHRFIPDAIRRGAVAVIGTQSIGELPVPYLQVADGRLALAYLSAALYAFPARRMVMIGITGTDGKTTTSNLVYRILQAAGLPAGLISTVNAVIGDQVLDTGFHVTTPEAPDVQRYLAQMAAAGLSHVVLEATSHGLAQQRVAACDFDIGVITNITHEHLDYHGTYEAYRASKGRLFAGLASTPEKPLPAPRGAVLNRDDASYEYLRDVSEVPQMSYGVHPQADLRAEDIRVGEDGIRFTAVGQGESVPIVSPLLGEYNVSNILAALAATVGVLDLPVRAAQEGIAGMAGVPGRMERIDLGQDFLAIVDFAHTPNALRRALLSARDLTQGRVIAVFGSAGLRDRAKRGMMAETSAQLADRTVLTAEDPRTESLEAILAEMAAGAEAQGAIEGRTFWRIPDRGEAIRFALRLARPGDLVIVCGKGHEQSMCFGEIEYPWDDRTAMRAAMAELLGVPGPSMPHLPTGDGPITS